LFQRILLLWPLQHQQSFNLLNLLQCEFYFSLIFFLLFLQAHLRLL
jgi:hypothetical protein